MVFLISCVGAHVTRALSEPEQTWFQSIAYRQSYLSWHFDIDRSSQNLSYDSTQLVSILVTLL